MSVIGTYVADLMEGHLAAEFEKKWGFEGRTSDLGGSRSGKTREHLLEQEFVTEADLKGKS